MKRAAATIAAFVTVLAAGCSSGGESAGQQPAVDETAVLRDELCDTYLDFVLDMDLMTVDEQRETLQDIYDMAKDLDDQAIEAPTRDLVEIWTNPDEPLEGSQETAIEDLGEACDLEGRILSEG